MTKANLMTRIEGDLISPILKAIEKANEILGEANASLPLLRSTVDYLESALEEARELDIRVLHSHKTKF